ncbi:hypothetical protein BT69DRAFT_219127 [Atractiella rhizophila]|nr:hypothetical protein BT69DRAFT_219127 [Atractiella rhizophila]
MATQFLSILAIPGPQFARRSSFSSVCSSLFDNRSTCSLNNFTEVEEVSPSVPVMGTIAITARERLPLELWDHIFEFVGELHAGKRQLCRLATVCRLWLEPIRRCLFRRILLNSLPRAEKLQHCLTEAPYLSTLISELEIDPKACRRHLGTNRG